MTTSRDADTPLAQATNVMRNVKGETEIAILSLIRIFEKQTGLCVSGIELRRDHHTGKYHPEIVDLKMVVEL